MSNQHSVRSQFSTGVKSVAGLDDLDLFKVAVSKLPDPDIVVKHYFTISHELFCLYPFFRSRCDVMDIRCTALLVNQGLRVRFPSSPVRERRGSVVECLTLRDLGTPGSSFTGVTALWFLSKTHSS